MTIEDRLRRAIAARTRSVDPSDDGLRRIDERLRDPGGDVQFPTNNRWYLVAAAAVVVAMIAGSVVLATGDEDGPTNTADESDGTTTTEVEDTTTSTSAPSTTTTTTTDTSTTVTTTEPPAPSGPPAEVVERAVWPRPSSDVRFDDPVAAASSWARFYAGFPNPVIGAFRQGDNRSGEVPVQPLADGPETTVLVRQLSDGNWYVIGSNTANITVTAPTTGGLLSCPQVFQGTALAFEGTVQVQIDAYQPDGDRVTVGSGIVTGGGGPAAPFDGQIDCTLPTSAEQYGIVKLYTVDESGEPGRSGTWEAATFPVRLDARAARS